MTAVTGIAVILIVIIINKNKSIFIVYGLVYSILELVRCLIHIVEIRVCLSSFYLFIVKKIKNLLDIWTNYDEVHDFKYLTRKSNLRSTGHDNNSEPFPKGKGQRRMEG